ncbi:MAG TPA: CpsD/CapB family tyrosine-protein kinase [Pirellulales bacterium]|jgi:Mrp family chromosome partitioning ATPase|nr:CpsD/CapB family tyrosine-protein kinase [Pirellulales bacterium]
MIRSTDSLAASETNGRPAATIQPAERRGAPELDKHFVGLYQRSLALRNGSPQAGYAIGVTSSLPDEGVSTVAIGLATCAALLGGAPVLLIDANLGRPSLARMFEIGDEPGLFEVLTGTMEAGDCIRPSNCDGLSLMTSGCWTSGIQPAYVPSALAALIGELRGCYATIVFDLPATEECSPSGVIGSMLDGVLLVVEAERIPDETARRAMLRLQRANVAILGVVLNKRK